MMMPTVQNSRLIPSGTLPLDQIQGKIEKLQNSQIERNKFHLLKEKSDAPRSTSGKHLDTILEGLQKIVHHRIGKMAEGPIAKMAPAVSWTDENIQLQIFYSSLRNQVATGQAFKLCEAIRMDADQKIQGILSSGAALGIIEAQQSDVISKTRELIGQVVFASDRCPQTLLAGIDLKRLEDTLQFVEMVVKNELQDDYRRLVAQNKAANAYALQDPDMVFYIEEPKAIAKILLTPRGELNLGMVGPIKEQFFPDTSKLLEYQTGILFVLERMEASWQKALDAVQIPSPSSVASTAMIRADLGLDPKQEITKLHCKQVVLSGLFSQLCQGPVGDCFAVSWAIKKHEDYLLGSLGDYIALAQSGYLTRMVGGVPEQFFFERTIADEAMSSQITLSQDGSVTEFSKAPFWECPNLIAACHQMGITDLDKRKDVLLQQIFGSKSETKTITWDDLIQACAENAAPNKDAVSELLVLGRYGFSLCNNRLLRAWETSLAGMAEARPGDYVRDNVNNSVKAVFDSVFASQEKEKTSYQKTLIEQVKKVFENTLNSSFRLVYNGSIPLPEVSSDGSSSSGGFELYQRDLKDLTNKGIRIATPEQFRTFILGVMDQTLSTANANVHSKKDREVIGAVVQAMHICASSKDFLKDVLYAYDDKNKKVPDPVANYQNLERTPMTSLDGDNPWEVMAIDTGKDFTPDIRTIKSKNPGDLLKWLLGIASWKESTQHYLSDGILNEEDTATSPQHAFNIEIEGPEFKDFLKSKLSADVWIKKTLVDSGKQISRAEMDKGAKLIYAQSASQWFSGQFEKGIPENVKGEMDKLFERLNSKVITVQQYAERSQDGLSSIFHLKEDQKKAMSIALDGMLLQALPRQQLGAIQQESVRFAKTNWDSGVKNLFFCCFFNPRTELVDFGTIAEDKTGLQPMDQWEWIDNQQWEMDPVLIK